MGFVQSRAESDIWMRENNALYGYMAVYVDDLFIAARDPGEITWTLEQSHEFKLKGVIGCLQCAASLGRFDIQQ
jgi:hypothetical protein